MAIDTTLYFQQRDGTVIVVEEVTAWRLGVWPVWKGNYRDLFDAGVVSMNNGSASPDTATFPVAASGQVSDTGFTGVNHSASDHVAHVAPRPEVEYLSGYFVAQGSAGDIPATPPMFGNATSVFTANPSNEEVTAEFMETFATGDLVILLTTGTLPTGLAAATTYEILKTGTYASVLLNPSTRAVVTFTTAGSGVHTMVQHTTKNPWVAGALPAGVRFIPWTFGPPSSTDPRL